MPNTIESLLKMNQNKPSAAKIHVRPSEGQTRHPIEKFVDPSSLQPRIFVFRLTTSNSYSQCPNAPEKQTGFGMAGELPTIELCDQLKKTPTTSHLVRAPPVVSKINKSINHDFEQWDTIMCQLSKFTSVKDFEECYLSNSSTVPSKRV